ncbi:MULTISPECIES: ferritin family protein [unclassified Clostridium]|uniref:ferritin-like domain-containing protein n=1 Tax=unclassified Clostridium TaxID=2614128 RepID=UPI00189C370D|nr:MULTISPECIES: ferritin family protein [unclassified Clostridium]
MKNDFRDLHENCSLGLPYPKIEISEKNSNYANLIKRSYAGNISELTAVTQYTYQGLIANNIIGNILKKIAEVEMHHLEILGELIVALGENPDFSINKKDKKLNWNSKFICTSDSIKDMLLEDIKNEEEAIKLYRKTANSINDENIIAILNRIILDEELHIKILTNLYEIEMSK